MSDYKSLESIIRGVSSGTDIRRKVVGVAGPVPNTSDGTEARRKVELTGRPDSERTGEMSTLARQMAIQHNIIDEEERPDDDVQIAISKFKGNQGNKVDLKPITDDRNNDNQRQDADSKKARKIANDAIGQPGSKTMTTEEKKRETREMWKENLVTETKSQDEASKSPLQKAYQKLNSKTTGQSSGLTSLTQKAGKLGVSEEELNDFEVELIEMLSEDTESFRKSTDSEAKRVRNYLRSKLGHVKSKSGKKHMKTKPKPGAKGDPANEKHKRFARRVALEKKAAGASDKDAARSGREAYRDSIGGGYRKKAREYALKDAESKVKSEKKTVKATAKSDTVKKAAAATRAAKVKETSDA